MVQVKSYQKHIRLANVKYKSNLADVRLLNQLVDAKFSNESIKIFSDFLKSLPSSSEVPRIEKDQLSQLYLNFVRGETDEALLDEVESRLISRLETYLSMYHFWFLWNTQENRDLDGSDNWWMRFNDSPVEVVGDRYGFEVTGQPARFIEVPYHRLLAARESRDYNSRVLAIDAVIQLIHDNGPLAKNFVEGGAEFLDWLNNQMIFRRR